MLELIERLALAVSRLSVQWVSIDQPIDANAGLEQIEVTEAEAVCIDRYRTARNTLIQAGVMPDIAEAWLKSNLRLFLPKMP